MGRVLIFAQLDIQDFVSRVEALGFKTSWITSKQTAEMKPFGGPIPGSPNAWALRVEAGDVTRDYLVGFFGRKGSRGMRQNGLALLLADPSEAVDEIGGGFEAGRGQHFQLLHDAFKRAHYFPRYTDHRLTRKHPRPTHSVPIHRSLNTTCRP